MKTKRQAQSRSVKTEQRKDEDKEAGTVKVSEDRVK